jgi:hypothetical protein
MLSRTASSLLRRSTRSVSTKFNASASSAIASVVIAPQLLSLSSIRPVSIRKFSSDTHDDFAAKRTVVDGEDEAVEMIKQHVTENPVMLYMKGNPSMPQCGFSAKIVQNLQAEGVDFSSVNVLDYPSIRDGIKKYSEWPTM